MLPERGTKVSSEVLARRRGEEMFESAMPSNLFWHTMYIMSYTRCTAVEVPRL